MGTKNTVRLIDPSGTSYYLSGGGSGQTPYSGSGTPWTAESTAPYELSLNDISPIWAPTPAPGQLIMGGGPPFSLGRRPLYAGYDNVTESVGIQLKASGSGNTAKDNAIALLNQLRQVLNTARFSLPCLLAVQSGTNTSYVEIYWADVPEMPNYIAEADGTWRVTITWQRSPLWSAGSLTTLQSAITVTNSGTGGNNNTRSLSTITGDLLYEGSPLNIKLDPVSGGAYFYFGTVYQRIYSTSGAGTTTTSSTSGAAAFNDATAALTNPARTRNGLRLRVMLRCTSISAKAQVRVQLISAQSSENLWIGPWVAGNATGVTQIDVTPQGVPLDSIRRALLTTGDVNIGLVVRSTDGTSVSVNVHSCEYLLYYTFCRVDAVNTQGGVGAPGLDYLQLEQAQNLNGTAYLPAPGVAYVGSSSGGGLGGIATVRGALPRAISGASLYMSWLTSTYAHTNTDTAAVTTTHLPLYRSVRGAA